MIRILGITKAYDFKNIYANGVPFVREIQIENTANSDIIVELKCASHNEGVSLRIEKQNENSELKDYHFEEYPVYSVAKRPNELLSYLNDVNKIELKKGEIMPLTLILTVTNAFISSSISSKTTFLSSNDNPSVSSQDEKDCNEFISGEASISFHCFPSFPSSNIYDVTLPVHFTTSRNDLSIDSSIIYMNDLHVGNYYEKRVTVENHSQLPTAFSIHAFEDPSYLCSFFKLCNNSLNLITSPIVLNPSQCTIVTLRIQPLQPGFHEIKLHLENETNLLNLIEFSILTLTTKAIKQEDIFFSFSPGEPLTNKDMIFDFGDCFVGKMIKKELFITNDSEYDVVVRPRSSKEEEVTFITATNSNSKVAFSEETPSNHSSIDRKEEKEPIKSRSSLLLDDELSSFSEEKIINEVIIARKSSFRLSVNYIPKKEYDDDKNLRCHVQNFYLLFELHLPHDYGEISLFCQAQTCGSFIKATECINYTNCLPNKVYEENLVITNESDIACTIILACGASSLSPGPIALSPLSSNQWLSIQDLLHRQIADIAYSIEIAENSTINIPVRFHVKTKSTRYSNWIDIINPNADPIQSLVCQIHAEIEQATISLDNSFSIYNINEQTEESINSIDFGKVAVGGMALECIEIVNNKDIAISILAMMPKEVTIFVIPTNITQIYKIHSKQMNSEAKKKKMMNNLNLDTTIGSIGAGSYFNISFPITTTKISSDDDDCILKKASESAVSDSIILSDDDVQTPVESSIDEMNLVLSQRYRSQSQVEVNEETKEHFEQESPNSPGINDDDDVTLDLKKPEEVLKIFKGEIPSNLSLCQKRRLSLNTIRKLKEVNTTQNENTFTIPNQSSVYVYIRYDASLQNQQISDDVHSIRFLCSHKEASTMIMHDITRSANISPKPCFSHFETIDLVNSTGLLLYPSNHHKTNTKSAFSTGDSFHTDLHLIPICSPDLTSDPISSTTDLPLITTGTSHSSSICSTTSVYNTCDDAFEREVVIKATNIECKLDTPQRHLHFGKLFTKTKCEKKVRICNNSDIDIPVLIRQSINYNMGQIKEEQELVIPKQGENYMTVTIEPSVTGTYTGSIVVTNLLNGNKPLNFILKANISQEITLSVLSAIPINYSTFSLNEEAQGILKIQNTSNRDLQYTIINNDVKLYMTVQDQYGDEVLMKGYECLVEIRRNGPSSNALSSNEREHLESSVW